MNDVFSTRGFSSLVQWVSDGKVAAKVATTYSLEQLADAHRASETGRTVGKISVVRPGIFATSGASNPTYTILALSLRGAEQLVRSWASAAG